MTNTQLNYDAWIGHLAVDSDGEKIGKIAAVYNDEQTGQPEWVTITTGFFGSKQTFAPIAGATNAGNDLQLAFSKDKVKGAPKVDPDGHLEASEEDELYSYYGLDVGESAPSGKGTPAQGQARDEAMTRSEEELSVATQSKEVGRARLVKRVVTEDVNLTVPVQHEEVRVEREAITDANRAQALDGAEITEGEHEMVLNAEELVVTKTVVPQERVKLAKDTVTENKKVSETVRKEQIDVDSDEPVKQ